MRKLSVHIRHLLELLPLLTLAVCKNIIVRILSFLTSLHVAVGFTCTKLAIGIAHYTARAGVVAFGPIVRAQVANAAKRRGLEVTIGQIAIGWFVIHLKDIYVKPHDTSKIAQYMPSGSIMYIDALTAKVNCNVIPLLLGPGLLTIARQVEPVTVEFTSAPDSGALHTKLLLNAFDVTVILEGMLVRLGDWDLREGLARLAEVGHTTVSGKGQVILGSDVLTLDGVLHMRDFSLGLVMCVVLTDRGELQIDHFDVTIGLLHVNLGGVLRRSGKAVSGILRFTIPVTSCQALLDSIPMALIPTVRGMRYTGTFGAHGFLAFDSRALNDLVLSYDFQDNYHVTEVPPQFVRECFTQPFVHRIYHPDGSIGERTTGPGTPAWVPLTSISPYMVIAVLTTEDDDFYRHRGFHYRAIRASIVMNLKIRRFAYGASTISMQLAKNLFLSREKTLSRKFEEIVLTDYLEQVFTKDEIMELYLNVVEFGPDIYGIGPAAVHYFGHSASELNLAESLFLSSILPAPVHYHSIRNQGKLPDEWQHKLIRSLEIAKRKGIISDTEFEEGKEEIVIFCNTGCESNEQRAL